MLMQREEIGRENKKIEIKMEMHFLVCLRCSTILFSILSRYEQNRRRERFFCCTAQNGDKRKTTAAWIGTSHSLSSVPHHSVCDSGEKSPNHKRISSLTLPHIQKAKKSKRRMQNGDKCKQNEKIEIFSGRTLGMKCAGGKRISFFSKRRERVRGGKSNLNVLLP